MAKTRVQRETIKNRNLTGASLVPGFLFFDETRFYTAGETCIWKNQLYRVKVGQSTIGKKEGDLTGAPDVDTVNWEPVPNLMYNAHASAVQTFAATRINLGIDTERIPTPAVDLAAGEMTVQETGIVFVQMQVTCSVQVTSGVGFTAFLQLDTGSGFVDIPNFTVNGFVYFTTDVISAYGGALLNVNKGDKLRVQVIRSAGTDTLETIPSGCAVNIFSMNGLKGDKGDPGSGGIIWKGDWAAQNYFVNDAVKFSDGNSYVCILDTTSQQSPLNTTYWDILAEKGDMGPVGQTGPSGDLNWRSTYDNEVTYNDNDVVEYNGSSYRCNTNGTSGIVPNPPTTTEWEFLAKKGADGSGSNVTIHSGGSPVPNTPHNILNYIGRIKVTDNAGKVDITLEPLRSVSFGASGAQTIAGADKRVALDTILKSDNALATLSGNIITFQKAATIKIDYHIFMQDALGQINRSVARCWLVLNTSTVVPYSESSGYSRGYTRQLSDTFGVSGREITVAQNDTLELWMGENGEMQAGTTIGNAKTFITIKEVE